ncbi:c2h2 finger domain containing protein [Rutstroemia sp. NJR-2017a BBW]|nr:c2h2 finger domain containing protein [Rutstroemia sp. NJR-2017a BBW]
MDIVCKRGMELRYEMMTFAGTTKVDKFLKDLKTEKPLLTTLSIDGQPPLQRSESGNYSVLNPLEECILATLWGFLDFTPTQEALQPWTSLHDGTLADFIILLNAAAEYQATIGTNQLIAYTLTCLRTCIDALHVKESSPGSLETLSHQACEPSSCKVECIRQIELQLAQYLDELSRVLFLKENLRSKTWWLSAFYSFCIQGVIRQALRLLCSKPSKNKNKTSIPQAEEEPAPKQYLHLGIRLFIASSGNHDPLTQDWSSEFAFPSQADGAPKAADYQAAQSALKQSIWKTHGIKSSAEYLKKLFEDPGTEPLLEPSDDKWSARLVVVRPEPYLPQEFTLKSCRKLRRDWDCARCAYTKEVVRVVNEHGCESQVYSDTEEKWAVVEGMWRKFSGIAISNTVRDLGGKGKGNGKEEYSLGSVLKVFDGTDVQSHTVDRIPIPPLPPLCSLPPGELQLYTHTRLKNKHFHITRAKSMNKNKPSAPTALLPAAGSRWTDPIKTRWISGMGLVG